MPTAPTPNMGLILPTLGSDIGTWDDELNAALGVGGVDDHDHSPGRGVKITPLGLNINIDLTFAGNRALNLGAAQLTAVTAASMAGFNRSFFVNSADSELYFRNNAGTNIKFTTGGTLNFSVVGGIGGDYTAVGALFSFDDATDRYLAQQQGSPRPWAGMAIGQLDIYQQAASIVNRVRQKSPNALAASYDLTWLTALPGSTLALQVSAAGQISASNTFASAVACSTTLDVTGNATVTTMTSSGAVTFGGATTLNTTLHGVGAVTLDSTLSVAGLISATLGVTLAADQHVTLQSGGSLKHGQWTKVFTITPTVVPSGSCSGGIDIAGGFSETICTAGTTFYSPIDGMLIAGGNASLNDNIVGAKLYWTRLTGSGNPTFEIVGRDAIGALSSMSGGPVSSAANPYVFVITNVTYPVCGAYLRIICPGTGTFSFYGMQFQYTH